MVLTRDQARAALQHVVRNVMGTGVANSPLELALTEIGVEDIHGLITIDKPMIDNLEYKREGETELTQLTLGTRKMIEVFLDFVRWRAAETGPIEDREWETLTKEEFNEFRLLPSYLDARAMAGNYQSLPGQFNSPVLSKSTNNSQNTPRQPTAVESFKRGIKRDPTLFPTLKDEKLNDVWHRSFATQARAQDVAEILNPNYVPSTPEEQELFQLKQLYMFAVLESTVKTDRGKAIVRYYEATSDAQKVYKDLSEHHLKSTKALMDSSDILSYISSVRLGSGDWKGTTEAFITHWQN
jgi:hypothetical protein